MTSLSPRSEAPGAQQGGGRLLCERFERRPTELPGLSRVERRSNPYRIGDRVEPHAPNDGLVIADSDSGDAIVIQKQKVHLAARVLLLVSSFETTEGLSARLKQR